MYNYLPVTFSHHLCAFKNTNSPIFFFFFLYLVKRTDVRSYVSRSRYLAYICEEVRNGVEKVYTYNDASINT